MQTHSTRGPCEGCVRGSVTARAGGTNVGGGNFSVNFSDSLAVERKRRARWGRRRRKWSDAAVAEWDTGSGGGGGYAGGGGGATGLGKCETSSRPCAASARGRAGAPDRALC